MDTKLLQGFIEEVESYLPIIRGGILVSGQTNGSGLSDLNLSLTHIQTIKGAASMIELKEVEEIAADLEKDLKILTARRATLTDEESRHLLDKLAELESVVAELLFSIDDFPEDLTHFLDESFDVIRQHSESEAEDVHPEAEAEEEFEIDEEMLEVFGMEAEDLLSNINANLVILENNPNNREALLEIRRNSHTLKGSAGIVGLKQLSKVAHRVEDLLDYLSENEIEGNHQIFEFLQSSTDCFSSLISSEKSTHSREKVAQIYRNFDRIMAMLQNGDQQAGAPAAGAAVAGAGQMAASANQKGESHPQIATSQTRSIVRVSLEKLDDLVKIVSGMVINRSIFEQRLSELEQQIAELNNSTRRLQGSTTKLETEFEANMLNVQSPKAKFQSQLTLAGNFGSEEMHSSTNIGEPDSFDTLEFDQYTEFHQTTRELIETTADTSAINTKLDVLRSNFEILFDGQRRLIDELQEKLLRLRMVKFGSLASRLQRTVRVTADEESKEAELFLEGENLEVDTQILDSLIEPLLHILRNAIAHGIETPETRRLLGKHETGRIILRAYSEGTHIVLSVTDDGRGISAAGLKERAVEKGFISQQDAIAMSDEEALSLVFLPGLTTAEEINQVSGRGVGLNIVKTQIARQQGTISIQTEQQKGSTFTIRLPMALAVTRSLLVKADQQTFAFPLKLVKHICECSVASLEKARREKSIQLGETVYKIAHLSELLGLPTAPLTAAEGETIPLLLIDTLDKPCALMIDKILKPEEIVIKPLGNPLKNVAELLGATILGDGKVIPVLDLIYLLKNRTLHPKKINLTPQAEIKIPTSVMIVDDSPSVRHLTSKIIKQAEWIPVVAKDGLEALDILQNSQTLPNVILTDVEMPQMDGYELLASLKRQENLRHIPVVMITSRAGDKHRQKAFDLGVSEYLSKPFEDSVLIEKIKTLAKI
ncbi:MAG: response regulator [Pyrinomonadaceae bacterium]